MSTTEAAVREDGRVILDVNVSADHVTSIGAMNGHEGDNGRVIPFVLVKNQSGQGSKPYNLENKTIDLVGTDSTGKLKVGGGYQPQSPAVGTFDFTMPAPFFQATGDYQNAYFRIKDGNVQVVSTINVKFTVVEGVGYLSSGDSQIYNQNIQTMIQDSENLVKTYTETNQRLVEGNQGELATIRDLINNYLDELNKGHAATLAGNNQFTGNNHFGGTTTIDNLQGGAIDKLNRQFTDLSNSLTTAMSNGLPKFTDSWSRDYIWGPGLSKPNNGNDFALSRFLITNNLCVIFGRGDVLINKNDADYWESTLTIPWKVNSATAMIADWHTAKGYFKPYHDISSSNTISASCSGRYTNETFSLNIIMIGAPV